MSGTPLIALAGGTTCGGTNAGIDPAVAATATPPMMTAKGTFCFTLKMYAVS
jgi:hypothetical protein